MVLAGAGLCGSRHQMHKVVGSAAGRQAMGGGGGGGQAARPVKASEGRVEIE